MKSIALKLWAGMMALVLVILLLLWLFQIVFLESFYTHMRISDIKEEGTSIIQLHSDGLDEEFKNRLEIFAFNNNLSIEWMDLKANSLYVTGSMGPDEHPLMMKNNVRLEVFRDVAAGNEVAIPLLHPRFGNKFMMIGLPIKTGETIAGVLILNMPLAPVEDTASILKRQLFYITVILLFTSLAISFLISRSFIRPILEINRVSGRMAGGDFGVRIEKIKKDEIGKLAETINYLGQQLSKIEQLRKDLIANVSHELRTPLSLIRGYAETIRDVSGNQPEKREKHIGIIIDETEHLSRVVDDILNFSQLQAGYVQLNRSRFSLQHTVDAVAKGMDVLSEKKGVQIVHQGFGEAIVEADEARIRQVLFNLINNAVNHTPEGGTITIRITEDSEVVKGEVSDTGIGIPAEEIPHIWDKYYKVSGADQKEVAGVGLGLGLAIVKSILDAHQASYGVESKMNVGTTFWFELKK